MNIQRSYVTHPSLTGLADRDEDTDPRSRFWFRPLNCDLKPQVVN